MLLSIIEWFNDFLEYTPQKIVEFLRSWGINVPPEKEQLVANCFFLIIIVIAIIIFIVPILKKWYKRKQKTNKWRRDLIEEKLIKDYRTYIDPEQNKLKSFWSRSDDKKKRIYIETRFQDEPPHDKEDPEEDKKTKDSKSLIKYYLNDILV